jgi:hypothetical protein
MGRRVSWAIENCTVQKTPNCGDQSGGGTRKEAMNHLGFQQSGPSDWLGRRAELELSENVIGDNLGLGRISANGGR